MNIYQDKSPNGERKFKISEGKLHIEGNAKTVGSCDFRETIEISTLDKNYGSGSFRPSYLKSGLILSTIGFCSHLFLVRAFSMDSFAEGPALLFCLGIAGAFVALMGLRRYEYVTFKNHSGVAVLTLFKSGPKKIHFDAFLQKLLQEIDGHSK